MSMPVGWTKVSRQLLLAWGPAGVTGPLLWLWEGRSQSSKHTCNHFMKHGKRRKTVFSTSFKKYVLTIKHSVQLKQPGHSQSDKFDVVETWGKRKNQSECWICRLGKTWEPISDNKAQDRKKETELHNYVGEKTGMDYKSKGVSRLTQVDLVAGCVQTTPALRYKVEEKIHWTEYLGW